MPDSYLDSQSTYVDRDGDTLNGVLTAPVGFVKGATISSGATLTLTSAKSGHVIIDTRGSATSTFTLPSAATAGLSYTFVCGDAAGEILVNPIAGQDIVGKTHGAENGTGIDTADAAGIKNTAATNVLGDFVTLVSDGVSRWYMVAVAGVWAAQ